MRAFPLTAPRGVKYNEKNVAREERASAIRFVGKLPYEVMMMKRLFAMLLVMLLMVPAGLAETTILGYMPDDEYIHQYLAPNGQLLWFTAMEQEPDISFADVNFDGCEDIVIVVAMGASNAFAEFFVYDPNADVYTLAMHPDADVGICNYQLHPELGIVESFASSGNAGLLHVWNLYRWEGNNLKTIRSAVSDEWSEDIFEGQTYTNIIHGDTLHVTVRDHTDVQDDAVLWEIMIPKTEAEHRDLYSEEMAALWQGLK